MPAINDQDGHVAQVTQDGRLQVEAGLPVGAASEAAVAANTAAVEQLLQFLVDERRDRPQHANIPYARDAGDRMRVVTDQSSTIANTALWWQNQNTWAAYYSSGAPTAMDARENAMIQSHIQFQRTRDRWVFS